MAIDREERKRKRNRQDITIIVVAVVAVLFSVGAAWKISQNDGGTGSAGGVGPEAVIQQATSMPVSTPADLPSMTGEECAAAGAEKGMRASWGSASDGCWLIADDGTVAHIGTWKE